MSRSYNRSCEMAEVFEVWMDIFLCVSLAHINKIIDFNFLCSRNK